ncbi:MAG: hypothetical protein R2761_13875 [Acidimicrobiales bacterium]
MSAAPGNQTPTVPAVPAAATRRRALFGAAIVVGLLVVAGGLWAVGRGGGDDGQGTAIGEAVPPTGADPAATGSTLSPDPPPSGATTTPEPGTTGTAPLLDPSLLSSVLISADDLGGLALPLEDTTVASGQDPEHPLTDYAICNRPLDRSQAGGAAKRVLTTNPLSPQGIVASTATVFTSAAAASAVIDEMTANAQSCETYVVSGTLPATVTVESTERTDTGAVIVERVDTVGSTADIRVIVDQVGDLVVTLEVTSVTADPAGLERLLTTRAGALPR